MCRQYTGTFMNFNFVQVISNVFEHFSMVHHTWLTWWYRDHPQPSLNPPPQDNWFRLLSPMSSRPCPQHRSFMDPLQHKLYRGPLQDTRPHPLISFTDPHSPDRFQPPITSGHPLWCLRGYLSSRRAASHPPDPPCTRSIHQCRRRAGESCHH